MKNTKVILNREIPNLGSTGDVVTVAGGYARNYLLPRNYAQRWNENAQKQIDQMQRAKRRREIASVDDARAVRDSIENSNGIRIAKLAGDNGRLFGAVSVRELAQAVKDQLDHTVDYRKFTVQKPIKAIGDYKVDVELHEDVSVELPVTVVPEKK